MRILSAIAVLLLGSAMPLHGQSTKADHYEAVGQPEEADRVTEATDLQFGEDAHQRMTLPVRVDGKGPYRFLVDTGADRSAISVELAARLRLSEAAPSTLHTVLGRSKVGMARVPVLDLAAKQVTDVDAALLHAKHMGADGILGLDALRSERILFDFKSRTLTIVPSKGGASVRDKDAIVVTGRIRNGRFVLTNARAENTTVTLVVDTGAEVSLGNEALRRKLMRSGGLTRSGPIELLSVTGEKMATESWIVRELAVGEVTLVGLPVVFADSHAFRPLGLSDKPALLLGMNALMGFEKVSIDFARRKLRMVVPEEGLVETFTHRPHWREP